MMHFFTGASLLALAKSIYYLDWKPRACQKLVGGGGAVLANASPLGKAKFANAPPRGLTRRANPRQWPEESTGFFKMFKV